MTIKGNCEHRRVKKSSFVFDTNDKMLAAKLILFNSIFITADNCTAYYTTDYKLEISEDISKEICYLAEIKAEECGEDEINKVIIANVFGEDDIVISKELK